MRFGESDKTLRVWDLESGTVPAGHEVWRDADGNGGSSVSVTLALGRRGAQVPGSTGTEVMATFGCRTWKTGECLRVSGRSQLEIVAPSAECDARRPARGVGEL